MAEQHFVYVGGPQRTRGANAPLICSALWAKQRSQIESWYIRQNCELADVISRLRAEDGFALLSERQLTYRLKLWGFSKKTGMVDCTTTLAASTLTASTEAAQASMSDALPDVSELSNETEQNYSMADGDTYFSTPTTAEDDANTRISTRKAGTDLCKDDDALQNPKDHGCQPRGPGSAMDTDDCQTVTETVAMCKADASPHSFRCKVPDTQANHDWNRPWIPISPAPELKHLLNTFQSDSRDFTSWSLNRLFSTSTQQTDRQLGAKDLAQVDLLADLFSAMSLHEEAFHLSRVAVLQTLPFALEFGSDHLRAKLTRLVKNAISSSDRLEVARIWELATAKYRRLDSVDPAGCLLLSHIGYSCYADQEPQKARNMCDQALSSMVNRSGTYGALAELHANRWKSFMSPACHHEAPSLYKWDEALRQSIGELEQSRLNDCIATVIQWIRDTLAEPDSCQIFTVQADALWKIAPDEYAQVDIESTRLFCDLWNRWQRRKDKAEKFSLGCDLAFELLRRACGLSQVELMSALASLVVKTADRGGKAHLNRQALHQRIRIENRMQSRSIFSLLDAHVEPLYMRTHCLSTPKFNELRREALRAFVEMNIHISESLLYDSRFRKTAELSELPSSSLCMTNSPRSSCSTDLRSFKGVQLRQWAKRMSKSSSRRWSQISEMSIATFSSSERWLQEHVVEPKSSLLLASTSKMTYISAPKLVGSSTLVHQLEANNIPGTNEKTADRMALGVDTVMLSSAIA